MDGHPRRSPDATETSSRAEQPSRDRESLSDDGGSQHQKPTRVNESVDLRARMMRDEAFARLEYLRPEEPVRKDSERPKRQSDAPQPASPDAAADDRADSRERHSADLRARMMRDDTIARLDYLRAKESPIEDGGPLLHEPDVTDEADPKPSADRRAELREHFMYLGPAEPESSETMPDRADEASAPADTLQPDAQAVDEDDLRATNRGATQPTERAVSDRPTSSAIRSESSDSDDNPPRLDDRQSAEFVGAVHPSEESSLQSLERVHELAEHGDQPTHTDSTRNPVQPTPDEIEPASQASDQLAVSTEDSGHASQESASENFLSPATFPDAEQSATERHSTGDLCGEPRAARAASAPAEAGERVVDEVASEERDVGMLERSEEPEGLGRDVEPVQNASADISRTADLPSGAVSDELGQRRYSLGHDPAIGRFRPSEADTALRVEVERDVVLERAARHEEYDWVDDVGRSYDAVGNFPARFFDAEWENLQARIVDHLDKAQFVPVDVSQFTMEQRSLVREFVDLFDGRVFIVGDEE